jgi:hypothetical protein
MFEVDSPTWIAVVVASVYLLQSATKDLPLCRWLSPFSLGWIIAGLMLIYPFVLKGSWMAMGAGYLLMGVLIINTLVLSLVSKMPSQMISYKSEGLEKVGLMFTGFICAGLVVLFKHCLLSIGQLLTAKHLHQDRVLTTWSNRSFT